MSLNDGVRGRECAYWREKQSCLTMAKVIDRSRQTDSVQDANPRTKPAKQEATHRQFFSLPASSRVGAETQI